MLRRCEQTPPERLGVEAIKNARQHAARNSHAAAAVGRPERDEVRYPDPAHVGQDQGRWRMRSRTAASVLADVPRRGRSEPTSIGARKPSTSRRCFSRQVLLDVGRDLGERRSSSSRYVGGPEREGGETMETSARNHLTGTVTKINLGAVMAEVIVDVQGVDVTAVITKESAERLGLVEGRNVAVIVKATDVMIGVG